MIIRELNAVCDLDRVIEFYRDAPDYWEMAEGVTPDLQKAADFFTDGPPGCDPDKSLRLGLFLQDRLSGLAELSFGYPEVGDAYLGFMMLGPWARNKGYGQAFLKHVEKHAKSNNFQHIYLAVLESNPRGFAFWRRAGFAETGITGAQSVNGLENKLFRLVKSL